MSETTRHTLHLGEASAMDAVPDASVHLVATSPPYPMIEMWDDLFQGLTGVTAGLLESGQGMAAFEAMHLSLDAVWAECRRVLVPGGILAVNIGDATRTLHGDFCLYPNHARIGTALLRLGLTPLPDILWRKPSNAPNKFMGSGMLPGGAYVTYEHEYILLFRNGGKRAFDTAEDKARRLRSAYFWEERNTWFSDLWTDLRGTGQRLARDGLRARSAAFPFELPFRLIQMYTAQGDTVLDPFVGTGTTMAAALASGRSSVGYERVHELAPLVRESLEGAVVLGQQRVKERLDAHRAFIAAREGAGKEHKHVSEVYGFPVVTGQEVSLRLRPAVALRWEEGVGVGEHGGEGAMDLSVAPILPPMPTPAPTPKPTVEKPAGPVQGSLFR